MRVTIIGREYVNTTIAACFDDLGLDLVNVEID